MALPGCKSAGHKDERSVRRVEVDLVVGRVVGQVTELLVLMPVCLKLKRDAQRLLGRGNPAADLQRGIGRNLGAVDHRRTEMAGPRLSLGGHHVPELDCL